MRIAGRPLTPLSYAKYVSSSSTTSSSSSLEGTPGPEHGVLLLPSGLRVAAAAAAVAAASCNRGSLRSNSSNNNSLLVDGVSSSSSSRGSPLKETAVRRPGMADPLRRTLSKLRNRRAQRAAAAATAGGTVEGKTPPDLEEPRRSPASEGPGFKESECWKAGKGGTPDFPTGICGSSTATPGSNSSLDRAGGSEEDDYYDNQRLPGWGCSGARVVGGGAVGGGSSSSNNSSNSIPCAGSRESTGRLRSQLQEAYYLLIHAMHDLPPSSPPAAPQFSPSRAHQSPPHSPVHAVSFEPTTTTAAAAPQGSPFCRRGISKSLESLFLGGSSSKPPALRRCRSHGAVQQEEAPPESWAQQPHRDTTHSPGSISSCTLQRPNSGGSPVGAPELGSQPCERGHPHHRQGGSFKPPAVTVRKLQKWMYKGRLLSLGMKGGRTGTPSPSKQCGPPLGGEEVPAGSLKGQKEQKVPADQRILLTDLIENVYIPSVSRRELKNFKSTEISDCRPWIASITVSKKRNWLHQSSPRVPKPEKGNSYKKITGQVLGSPSPFLEPKIPQTFSKLLGHESPNRSNSSVHAAENGMTTPLVLPNGTLDFGEDNDADDEGEIWYNPIPEDDDPDFPFLVGDNVDQSDTHVGNYKKPSGNSLVKVAGHKEGLPHFSDCGGDAQSREISSAECVHSMEHLQGQKLKPVCNILTGYAIEDTPTVKGTSGGPGMLSASKLETGAAECSPPSPNPLKKGSINWSFPDKIKSPRTVRKLSIKMKKLPELSRKLSVKGNSSHTSSDNSSLLKNNCQDIGHASLPSSGNITAAASRNVISRYHLDSSVSSQHNYKKKSNRRSKSSSKGGYLSDGDSPELITKSGKHSADNRIGKGKETCPINSGIKAEIDIDAFRHYNFSDQPKCSQYISGLMSIHFYGAEDLKPPRMDSKDVFCAIQVDSVNKARTALLTCRTSFLDMDHTFNIEIENAQHLKLVVFSWEPTPRKNRVCCHGTVVLPTLFRVTKTHQLAVKLEPRGLIYVKLTLLEQWENSLNGLDGEREPVMFGVEARKVVEKENVGLMVPLLMRKCIMEIESRGCQVVGLYRLCGSAAVKKELREAFEKDSKAVTLCETQYPDINVITGVLKDYLRELPSPLITKQLYEAVLDAMVKTPLKMTANGCENDPTDSEDTVALLDCLPEVEKATLKMLLDHLKLVASYNEVNRMTCQNLAVCFGPVLLSQRQETSNHNNRVFTDSEELASALDFKKHIEVLHYLLQLWPVQHSAAKESALPEQQSSVKYLRPKKQRPQMLNLSGTEISGILRSRPARLDSPSSNRYAGDWSGCGENYFINPREALNETDYDDVPSEDAESGDDSSRVDGSEKLIEHTNCMSKEHTFQAYLTMQTMETAVNHKVNLKDLQESIDTLIGNLERELNKNKLNIRY